MKNCLRDLRKARGWTQEDLAIELGVSRQTVLQRVKRGELHAVHISCGRRKGLRIKVPAALPDRPSTP